MKHVYTSVDIGSDTIKVVVCELVKTKLNLLAASSVKSKGIKKGVITSIEDATISLKQAFNEVESMLGIKIKKVIVSVPSYFTDFNLIKGAIEIDPNSEIDGDDITKLIQVSVKENIAREREMVTVLPIDFTIDDKAGIKDPKGLVGSSLGMRSVLVATPKKNIYSVVSVLDSIGIEVVDISLNAIGDLYAFRTKEIDAQIGAIINIGSETTNVSLYNKGIIVKNSILQMGGKNIDNDIAYVYKIDLKTAKHIKEKFALASKTYANPNEFYELDDLKINQFEISEVANARITEILNLAKKEIGMLTNKPIDYVIITGGVSNMAHFTYAADVIFNKSETIGSIKLIGIRNNKYSSCIGNIIYFINKLKLKGKEYSMISSSDMEELLTTKKNLINISNESMLGKVFGYFFGE